MANDTECAISINGPRCHSKKYEKP